MKTIELSKETLRVLTQDETELVAGGARATNPSRIPCISDNPWCMRPNFGDEKAHAGG